MNIAAWQEKLAVQNTSEQPRINTGSGVPLKRSLQGEGNSLAGEACSPQKTSEQPKIANLSNTGCNKVQQHQSACMTEGMSRGDVWAK